MDEFTLRDQFYPLDEDVNVSSLEENIFPFAGFDHFQDEANVELLIFWRFVVFLDLAEHADYR